MRVFPCLILSLSFPMVFASHDRECTRQWRAMSSVSPPITLVKRVVGFPGPRPTPRDPNHWHQIWLQAPASREEVEATVQFWRASHSLRGGDLQRLLNWRIFRFATYREQSLLVSLPQAGLPGPIRVAPLLGSAKSSDAGAAHVQAQHPEAFMPTVMQNAGLRHAIREHLQRYAERMSAMALVDRPRMEGLPRDLAARPRLRPVLSRTLDVMSLWPQVRSSRIHPPLNR